MELHPILEKDTCPNPGLWYVISAVGDSPSMRVGHTCTYILDKDDGNGKIYVIGGANPDGPFNDVYVLNLTTMSWDCIETSGFGARYEHSAFVPKSQPDKIFIFGGANQGGNVSDIQMLDTVSNSWTNVTVKGAPPSARTYHTTACIDDTFIVYSGGQSAADPVGDRQVHCFDAVNLSWSILNVKGDPPKPRHGHVTVAVGKKLFIHGGMSGSTFYDDLHVLDLSKHTWNSVKQKKGYPSSRAAHGAVCNGTDVYVFGGMNKDGALDDAYKLDTVSMKWKKVELSGPPPASRLDFAMCEMQLKVAAQSDTNMAAKTQEAKEALETQLKGMKVTEKGDTANQGPGKDDCSAEPCSSQTPTSVQTENCDDLAVPSMKIVNLCFLTGGMDTEGEIFDDCLVMVI